MKSLIPFAIAAFSFAFTGLSSGADHGGVTITVISTRPHPDDPEKELVVKKVELAPLASAPPHVHPGMVNGYVQSGSLDFQLKDGPLLKLKAGDTFFEPAGSHHMVARSTTATERTIIIAFVVNPKGAPLSIPLDEYLKQNK